MGQPSPEVQNRGISGPKKGLMSSKDSYKKNYFTDCSGLTSSEGQRWKEHRRFVHTALKDFGMRREILEPKIHEEIQVFCPLKC